MTATSLVSLALATVDYGIWGTLLQDAMKPGGLRVMFADFYRELIYKYFQLCDELIAVPVADACSQPLNGRVRYQIIFDLRAPQTAEVRPKLRAREWSPALKICKSISGKSRTGPKLFAEEITIHPAR